MSEQARIPDRDSFPMASLFTVLHTISLGVAAPLALSTLYSLRAVFAGPGVKPRELLAAHAAFMLATANARWN